MWAVAGVIITWLFLGSAPAHGDGGAVRMSAKKGGLLVTLFTAPTPFRAGPVDISVLVQDALTGEPRPQTPVTVCMTKPGQPVLEYPATAEAATNKLLRAAQFQLPEAGRWQLEVQVGGPHGSVVIGSAVEAAAPVPRWCELWPWIAWPMLPIALFSIRQVLARRPAELPSHRRPPAHSRSQPATPRGVDLGRSGSARPAGRGE